jgi:hypothetical protein
MTRKSDGKFDLTKEARLENRPRRRSLTDAVLLRSPANVATSLDL